MQDRLCFSGCDPHSKDECFLVRSDVRELILGEKNWLALQGQSRVGLLCLCFTLWPKHRTPEAGEGFTYPAGKEPPASPGLLSFQHRKSRGRHS